MRTYETVPGRHVVLWQGRYIVMVLYSSNTKNLVSDS